MMPPRCLPDFERFPDNAVTGEGELLNQSTLKKALKNRNVWFLWRWNWSRLWRTIQGINCHYLYIKSLYLWNVSIKSRWIQMDQFPDMELEDWFILIWKRISGVQQWVWNLCERSNVWDYRFGNTPVFFGPGISTY